MSNPNHQPTPTRPSRPRMHDEPGHFTTVSVRCTRVSPQEAPALVPRRGWSMRYDASHEDFTPDFNILRRETKTRTSPPTRQILRKPVSGFPVSCRQTEPAFEGLYHHHALCRTTHIRKACAPQDEARHRIADELQQSSSVTFWQVASG